ncbi:hypothetical protein TI04_04795 [Achromatium sp. WMS2]|nr:hypothetical protein TI04_04795 [Achromatium sp. WMS2]
MHTIDRYLLTELLKSLFAILIILGLIIGTVGLLQLLEKATISHLNPKVVLPLMGFYVLRFLARTVPPAFFVAILMVLGRMYQDYEITALASCGVSMAKLYRSISKSLIITIPLTAWLALIVQPWAAGEMETIIIAQKQAAADLIGIKSGTFNEYMQGNLVFYVEDIDGRTEAMRNIFIQHRHNDILGLVTASHGQHTYDSKTRNHFVTLTKGRRYEGNPGTANFTIAEFDSYTLRIAESPQKQSDVRAARHSWQLYNSSDIKDRTEFWERLSYPLSMITLMLVAIPLSRSLPRQGIYGRLVVAFLVYFMFLNMHSVAVSWMKKQVTPEWLGMWWVQAVLLCIVGLILVYDSYWFKRLRRKISRFFAPPVYY